MYDITKRRSFENLDDWLEEAKLHIGTDKAVFIIVGHKSDRDTERAVSTREGKTFSEFHGLNFIETSARTGENVEEAFQLITREIYSKLESGNLHLEEGWDGIKSGYIRPKETFTLVENEQQGGGCCG